MDNINNNNSNDNWRDDVYGRCGRSSQSGESFGNDGTSQNNGDDKESHMENGFIFENKNSDEFKKFEINNEPLKEKKKKKKRGYMSHIAAVLIGAMLGSIISIGGILYIAPKTSSFKNTALYSALKGTSSSTEYTGSVPSFSDESESMSMSDVISQVEPAVVGVATKSVSSNSFFGQQQESQGLGSGVIISEDGYILTNYHVIANATEVTVILNENGESKNVAAKVVNYDSDRDVAIVKVTDDVAMPGVAELGDSDQIRKGQQVIAIGNPLGTEFSGTVTAGIISNTNTKISTSSDSSDTSTFIQTDAAINPGNSGGPLMNASGQVIGINSEKISSDEVEGMGFAIPINDIKELIPSLMKQLLKIGIGGRNLTEAIAKENNLPASEGVLVLQVEDFSPAEKAGLKIYDIITEFDGQKVTSVADINKIKATKNAGDTVKVGILRDGKEKTLDLTLEESTN